MKNNKKGFTLAELLIVIAIIAILIAIAIPVFGAQLENARISADHANIRSAYALIQTAKVAGVNVSSGVDTDGDGTADLSDGMQYTANGKFETSPAAPIKMSITKAITGNQCATAVGCPGKTAVTGADKLVIGQHVADATIEVAGSTVETLQLNIKAPAGP